VIRDEPEPLQRWLASHLRRALRRRSVRALARATGWHRSTIYGLLAGTRSITIDRLGVLAAALGTTCEALVRDPGPSSPTPPPAPRRHGASRIRC
jgi:transcriptional regulator with XRE-family HTH domain